MKNELYGKLLALVLLLFITAVLSYLYFTKLYGGNRPDLIKNNHTVTPAPASSENITVTSPLANDLVGQDFQITGKARVFENIVSIRVKNKITGQAYVTDTTSAYGGRIGRFVDFSYTVHLTSQSNLRPNDLLIIEVYQLSAKDGSEIDKVSIPVQFTPVLD